MTAPAYTLTTCGVGQQSAKVSSESLLKLVAMGFNEEQARQALQENNDIDTAISRLVAVVCTLI